MRTDPQTRDSYSVKPTTQVTEPGADVSSSTRLWGEIWIEVTVGIVTVIAVATLFNAMRTGAWIGFFVLLAWGGVRIRRHPCAMRCRLSRADWPLYLLIGLTLISLLIRPHSFLDSYSYRLPQMFFWLQEGRPWSVPYVDGRINQMPHVWSFISAVFFLPFGERGIAIPNWISYLLLIGIFLRFMDALYIDRTRARWIIVIFVSAPVMVMQAPSNDNTLACAAFLMLSAYFALMTPTSTRSVWYSAFAFALCCGIKPQYTTLAPLWLFWFLFGSKAPIRFFKGRTLGLFLPILILCSPLPTFYVNHFHHGSIFHPQVAANGAAAEAPLSENSDESEVHDAKRNGWERHLHSATSLTVQLFALPVNPVAEKMTSWLHRLDKIPVLNVIDWQRQRIYPILIAENASLSAIATLALLVGIFMAKKPPRKILVLGGGAFVAMVLAIMLTTPGTLGRSFVGFLLLLCPLAFAGLARVRSILLAAIGWLALLLGSLTIIVNPAAPLWPAQTVLNRLPVNRLPAQADQYPLYAERIRAGHYLMQKIRSHESPIGAIIQPNRPMAELWLSGGANREVIALPPDVTRDHLETYDVRYLIVRHPDLIENKEISSAFLERINSEVEAQTDHTSFMQFGDEPWYLLRTAPLERP